MKDIHNQVVARPVKVYSLAGRFSFMTLTGPRARAFRAVGFFIKTDLPSGERS